MEFNGRILVLGCGSVAQCTIPLLTRHVVKPEQVTIVDFVDNRARVADQLAKGVTYVQDRVTQENLAAKLTELVGVGDIVLDLAWNIDCQEILTWCHDHGVMYLNTSVEVWDPYEDASTMDPRDRSLYVRHMAIRRMMAGWSTPGATAVLEHGANPGLVSHMTKEALTSIAARALADPSVHVDRAALESALVAEAYNQIAMHLGVKVIHVAERDTQITDKPKEVDEFVNTWSVDGLYEEGVAPAELGWGTHERRMPEGAFVHQFGPSNQLALARMGMDTPVRSWTPAGEIIGYVIRHGEAFTICDHLTVWDGDRPMYRPTVHYAYGMPDVALASLQELRARHLVMQSRQRILNDEIISGGDYMGVLLMGHPYRSWWTGSCLTIDAARALLAGQSATTLQVGASVSAAVQWMVANPTRGICVPDDLPWREVLANAKPYLGVYHDEAADWGPLDRRDAVDLFARYNSPSGNGGPGSEDEWQFHSFLVP